jgi:uncharacterized protein
VNRRNFLGNSARQLVALNAIGLTSTAVFAGNPDNRIAKEDKDMQFRVLGNTGIRIPIISMGVMNANNPNLLKAAWDKGIRHFDTAWYYQNGNNEKMVGSVMRELNIKREDVTIATKVGLFGPPLSNGKDRKELFLKRFAESIDRLKMNYVDILYFHAAEKKEEINDPYIREAFTELKSSKKIRFAGFSTHNDWSDMVTDAAGQKFYDVILLSFNFSMYADQKVFSSLKLAYDAGIGLVAMKTQCQQEWYKNELPPEQQKFYEGKQMNTALLKWALKHEFITTAIPGFTTYQQIDEDMSVASNLNFTQEEEDFLKSKDVKLAIQSVCRHCGKCVGTCPNNVDIPSLMRSHMYSFSYGNPLLAKQTISYVRNGRGIDLCKNCNECSGQCQYRVPVANRIRELKEIFC